MDTNCENVYIVTLFFNGTSDDVLSLQKHLAQSISDEYSLRRVFGVTITAYDQDYTYGKEGNNCAIHHHKTTAQILSDDV